MRAFLLHNAETAANPSASILNAVKEQLGFTPHLFAVLAESEPALLAFAEMNRLFSISSFDAAEREVIQLTASVQNQSGYCVAGHSAFAAMQEIPSDIASAIRADHSLKDVRLEALRRFIQRLMKSKGPVPREEIEHFIQSGFTRAQALEAILGISLKTFSNLTSHLTDINLDDRFEPFRWASQHSSVGAC